MVYRRVFTFEPDLAVQAPDPAILNKKEGKSQPGRHKNERPYHANEPDEPSFSAKALFLSQETSQVLSDDGLTPRNYLLFR